MIPRHPPLSVHLQELLSPRHSPRSPGKGEEEGTAAQPIRIQRPAQPPQWPRMSAGPIGIQHPRARPSLSQRPMTPPRWWVPQCTSIQASTPLICHSLTFQQPMEIQHSSLAWTAVEFQGFISQLIQTPGAKQGIAPADYTISNQNTDPRQDLTATLTRVNNSGSVFSSPSLLQPCTKPFSVLPSRRQMTSPTREAGEATRERPGIVYPLLPRTQRPDTQVVIEAALPETAALDRRAQPPTVLEIGDTSLPQQVSSPRRRPSQRQSRKRRRNRSTGVYWPPKRSPPHGRWCE